MIGDLLVQMSVFKLIAIGVGAAMLLALVYRFRAGRRRDPTAAASDDGWSSLVWLRARTFGRSERLGSMAVVCYLIGFVGVGVGGIVMLNAWLDGSPAQTRAAPVVAREHTTDSQGRVIGIQGRRRIVATGGSDGSAQRSISYLPRERPRLDVLCRDSDFAFRTPVDRRER